MHSSTTGARLPHPDCSTRSVTGLLCLLLIEVLRWVWFDKADSRHRHLIEGFVANSGKGMTASTAAASSSDTPLHIQIPIAVQYLMYRSLLPAVSSIEAYPTPAQ